MSKTAIRRAALAAVSMILAGLYSEIASAQGGDYVLNPGDLLEVSVWKEDALNRQVLVLPDGSISFPLVGFVQTQDMTVRQVQDIIAERLTKFISNPVVTVSVTSVSGHRIYIVGKVRNPGAYTVAKAVDVMQALSLGGGLTTFADEDEIQILRRVGDQLTAIPFDYSQVINGLDLSTNIQLQSGDIVVVP